MKPSIARLFSAIIFALGALLLTGMDGFASNSAGALSETNPLDIVLVIDASDSMTYDADAGEPMRDPSQCNPTHNCHPFEEAKDAAKAFVDQLNFPDDRVSVVIVDNEARVDLGFSADKIEIQNTIDALGVVEPDVCDTASGPCREYERDDWGNIIDLDGDGIGDQYLGFRCPIYNQTGNPSTCTTTAIGQGLLFAGNEFDNTDTFREGSRRVVILLTDGAANAPSFVCPNSTWTAPFCRDLSATSRHCLSADYTSCIAAGGVVDPDKYDADDYARDMADFVSGDQEALVYTIGLGPLVQTSVPIDSNGWGAGEQLLRYTADMGNGAYYYAPSGEQLDEIFQDIYSHLSSGPKTWVVTKTDDTDDGSCNDDCSLREAIASTSAGDTVTFIPSLAGQTIALTSTITINTNLAINGSNLASHVQISGDTDSDGTGDISVFMIAAGTTVEIADLDIISGHYTEALAAGGINNYGDLTLTNCSFSGNTGDQGGAIHNRGSLTISNSFFMNNTAIEGGVVFNDIDNTSLISVSTFTNNTATALDGLGGAAGAIANIGTLTVYDSFFTNNSADSGGGAIVNSLAGSTTVQGSTFTGNAVLTDIDFSSVNYPGYGGAIYNYSGTLTVNSSAFSDNVAGGGAAISIGSNDPYSTEESLLVIENSTFSGNIAGFVGGGVNISSGTATISTSTFINNSAEGGGGVMNGGSLTLVSTTFDSNTGGEGGGVFNFGSLTVNKSNFFQNVAAIIVGGEGSGAAGAVLNWGISSISRSTFSGNSAESGGGAIGNSNNGDLYGGTLNVTDSIFTNNSTLKYGGAIYNYSGTLSVSGSAFTDNTAEYGGAINVGNFDNIPTDGDGNVTVDHSLFSGNTASYIAGGVHIFEMDATISGCTFVNNSAEYGGGLVAILGTHNISNSTFYNNSSSEDPGGGIVNGGSLTLTNSTFSDNIGGGLYNLPDSSLSLRNNILANSPSGVDCYNEGTLAGETNNLIEINGDGDFACGTPISTDDPGLGLLADNGGPTQTMALLAGSPAIDSGDDASCLDTDQRGIARPQGDHCDIGAYEYEPPPTSTQSINLESGWNLVSFNLQPLDTGIATVLSSIDGDYNLVYAWDASGAHSESGNWMKYDPIAPAYQNSLDHLDETMGFWIYMLSPQTLEIMGYQPTTTHVTLADAAGGWNLVAYPSSIDDVLPEALSDHGVDDDFSLVYAYHADDATDPWKLFDRTSAPYANDLLELASGWGYWIRVSADNDWSVEYSAP